MCVYVYLHIYIVCVYIFFLQTRPTKLGIIKSPEFPSVSPLCSQYVDGLIANGTLFLRRVLVADYQLPRILSILEMWLESEYSV